MRSLALALLLAPLLTPAPAAACTLELILAIDVSGSIDSNEFELQAGGLADAFEDPSLVAAVEAIEGGALVTVTHWSRTSRNRQMTAWHRLTGAFVEVANGFADYPRAILRKLLREIDQPMILSKSGSDRPPANAPPPSHVVPSPRWGQGPEEGASPARQRQPLPNPRAISYIDPVPSGLWR